MEQELFISSLLETSHLNAITLTSFTLSPNREELVMRHVNVYPADALDSSLHAATADPASSVKLSITVTWAFRVNQSRHIG